MTLYYNYSHCKKYILEIIITLSVTEELYSLSIFLFFKFKRVSEISYSLFSFFFLIIFYVDGV